MNFIQSEDLAPGSNRWVAISISCISHSNATYLGDENIYHCQDAPHKSFAFFFLNFNLNYAYSTT